MFQRQPALRFIILFILGIITSSWFSIKPIYPFFSIILLSAILAFVIIMYKKTLLVDVILQTEIIMLGAFLNAYQQYYFKSREINPQIKNESITIYGTIDSQPVLKKYQISYVVKVDSLLRKDIIQRCSRRILVMQSINKNEMVDQVIEFGNIVEINGNIERFPFQRNPGEFDYGKYLSLHDIQGLVSVKGLKNIKIIDYRNNWNVVNLIYTIRKKLYSIIDTLHSPIHASFLKGLIFGYKAEIPTDIKQSFIDTGTIHILAVSGSNVAFVAFIIYVVFSFFRIPKILIKALTIAGLIIYMLIVGSGPSVVRATIMAIIILIGTMFERKTNIYNSISVAAIIILIFDTNNLFDVGFQLSFIAVLSIVYLYPRFKLIIEKISHNRIVVSILKVVAVSIAAQLGTIPFTAYYFNRIPIASFIANIFVVPISGLNIFLGTIEILISFVSYEIANLYAIANNVLIYFLLKSVIMTASLPFSYFECWQFSKILFLLYYSLLVGLLNIDIRRVRIAMIIFILIFTNVILYSKIFSSSKHYLRVTVLDVGQGDAIFIEFPNGRNILIDTGPSTFKYDTGEKILIPFFKRHNISKLDYLLITHSHNDHIGGAFSIIKSISVDTLVINKWGVEDKQVASLIEIAQAKGIGIKSLLKGQQLFVDVNSRFYTLSPGKDYKIDKNKNNMSIVAKICYGVTSILLTGDAEIKIENQLINNYNNFIDVDILKVGHHGSISASSNEFLRKTKPKIALISVGVKNNFNHPSNIVLDRLTKQSIEVERTDEAGAVIYESDGKEWKKKNWHLY